MKIVQINCVYKYGSTGKIVSDLHSFYLQRGHESFVIYGRGKKNNDTFVTKASSELEAKIHSLNSRLFGNDFGFSQISTRKIIKFLKKIKPDVVHLHCLNGHFVNVYKLLNYLKNNNYKTVLTLHAEIMHTAGCEHAMDCKKWIDGCYKCSFIKGMVSKFYRDDAKICYKKMKNSIDNFNNLFVVGVSKWVTERAKMSSIFSTINKFYTITNGIDVSSFKYNQDNDLRKKMGISTDKKVVLHVTPNFNSPIKGSKYLIEIARLLPDFLFVVVGDTNNICEPNIVFVGRIIDKVELSKYYSMANCLAMTSVRETYPTVCLEATSCSLNVVGFDTGGVKETIPTGMGTCVKPFDCVDFSKQIIYWSNVDKKINPNVKTSIDMANEYLELYKECLC